MPNGKNSKQWLSLETPVTTRISSGSGRRSFELQNDSEGVMLLTISSDSYAPATLVVNFAKPPPLPSPAPVTVSAPKPNVSIPKISSKPSPSPAPQLSPEPTEVEVATVSAELRELNIESLLSTTQPEVLSASDSDVDEAVSFFDELFSWLEEFIFDKIWL